jgi:hypothetical protein
MSLPDRPDQFVRAGAARERSSAPSVPGEANSDLHVAEGGFSITCSSNAKAGNSVSKSNDPDDTLSANG